MDRRAKALRRAVELAAFLLLAVALAVPLADRLGLRAPSLAFGAAPIAPSPAFAAAAH